jgi:hypothetical protein
VDADSYLAAGLLVENPGRALKDSTYVVIRAGARVVGEIDVSGCARLIVEPGADTTAATFTGISPDPRE